jgi:hypothetical protein
MRTIKRAIITLLLVGVMAIVATTANATPDKSPKTRDASVVLQEIESGKAKQVHIPGREVRTHGVWNGCKFVFLKTKVKSYQGTAGEHVDVSSDPEPLPPMDPGCVERNPTEDEKNAMRVEVGKRNTGAQAPGAPPLPTKPPS